MYVSEIMPKIWFPLNYLCGPAWPGIIGISENFVIIKILL